MASLKEQVRTDTWAVVIAEDRRIVVELEAEAVYGFTGNIGKDKTPSLGGLIVDYRKSCWVEGDAYDPQPQPNTMITVDSSEYVILNTDEDALGSFIRLDLGDKYS